jgi:hypothetical protein
MITTEDLYRNKYDLSTLKANIYVVSLVDILKSQTLTADFCVKYILNNSYQFSKEEEMITLDMVKIYQPHITFDDLAEAEDKLNDKKMRHERIDSVDDFEKYLN